MSAALNRAGVLTLLALSLAALLLGRMAPQRIDQLTAPLTDAAAPVLAQLRRPIDTLRVIFDDLGTIAAVHRENLRLKVEIEELRRLTEPAERIASENTVLRALLHMPPHRHATIKLAARVIGEASGPFVRTALIDAGQQHGVTEGMAAINSDGLVGRVINAGRWSARLLLLTDLNSRVPVMIEPSRDQAILAGTNTPHPELTFLPPAPRLAIGDRIVTSGQGGMLPAGLVVGRIAAIEGTTVHIATAVDWHRLDHVHLLERADLPSPDTKEDSRVGDHGDPSRSRHGRRRRHA